jgi:chromosome partitioning protein
MSVTVLEPLPAPGELLPVVREWRIDELRDFLEEDRKDELAAAVATLDYGRDAQPQFFVPPSVALPAAPLGAPVVFVCVNQKGGAGKTTTSVELAAAFVAMGYTVRLVDADHQEAALSAWIRPVYDGVPPAERYTLTDVMYGRQPLDEATYATGLQGLYIVPSGEDLAAVEYDPKAGRDGTLRAAIRKSQAPVDITIIDAPPALGKLSINALIAATKAVVPLKVGALDAEGLTSLHRTIRAIQEDANPELDVAAAVLTAWDKSWLAAEIAARARRDYPEAIVGPARRSVKAANAAKFGLPVRVTDPSTTTAYDYDQLARLLLAPKGATA